MNRFEEMETFVRIVDAGSITRAAEIMDTVKSAVSKRLSELEKRLQVTLLNRTTRKQTLTESGKSYYQQCLKIMDDVKELENSLRNEHCALSGNIKIAAPLSFGITHLSPALIKFMELHPDIKLDMDFNDRKIDLIEEGFDIAIRISNLNDSTMIARKITQTRILLCASPEYIKNHGLPKSPNDLKQNHVKLRYQTAPDYWSFKDQNDKKFNIKLPSRMISNNGQFLSQAAIEGQGMIMIPDFVVYKAVRLGQLVPLLTDYMQDYIVGAYALYPQTRHLSRRVRSLVDFLFQYFGEKPYWQL